MNQQHQKELAHINNCLNGFTSIPTLCKKLKVTPSGLGHRMVRLMRLERHTDAE